MTLRSNSPGHELSTEVYPIAGISRLRSKGAQLVSEKRCVPLCSSLMLFRSGNFTLSRRTLVG